MMAAISTSEMLVSIYQTPLCNIPEDGHLHQFGYLTVRTYTFYTFYFQYTTTVGFTGQRAVLLQTVLLSV
jgi:hypothetical protein